MPFILTTEDSLKIIGYAWLPMVVWPLLTAQTIRHPQIFYYMPLLSALLRILMACRDGWLFYAVLLVHFIAVPQAHHYECLLYDW